MRDLGWMEGKNVDYRFVYADGELNRLDALASELIRQQVDVIVVGNALTTRALQRATKTIPIVMASVSDPVGNGFVASLAKPGDNITGVTAQQEEVLGKRIGILHDVAPGARRVAILLNESNPSYAVFWAAAQSACASLVPKRSKSVDRLPHLLRREVSTLPKLVIGWYSRGAMAMRAKKYRQAARRPPHCVRSCPDSGRRRITAHGPLGALLSWHGHCSTPAATSCFSHTQVCAVR
jgi:hypothetical protein